ncbi:MAG TPA: porin [Usitatibacter sp.]|nr:porin [Usitatibacter sp.]
MNKKLIALAIVGACVAPAAMAQTAGPVVLYGRIYETVVSVEGKAGGGNPEIPRRTRVDDQASLLGVRGTEDLGGGLKAFFQLETAFQSEQNNAAGSTTPNAFATRNSGVGLEGGWGSFVVGRWDTPYKVSTYPVDAFGDLTMAGISGLGHDQGNFDRRDQNMLQYWSPDFAGFQFKVMAQANETKTCDSTGNNCNNPHDTSANLTYTRGPLYAFLAYEDHKDPSAAVSKEDGWSLGGKYSFGPIQVGLEYEKISRDAAVGNNPSDRKEALANLIWTFGNNQLIYQYQESQDGEPAGANGSDYDCHSNTLGYKYIFSKRTFFIAEYMQTKNKDKATCSFATTATFPVKGGNDVDAFAVGLQHVF